MSDFETIDPNEPATVENVVRALMHLQIYDEATLADAISHGRLNELFPFRLRRAVLPPDAVDERDVVEASPLSWSESEYTHLLKSSMRLVGDPSKPGNSVEANAKTKATPTGRQVIRPLHDRVIIRRLEEERKTASGIVIPDTATEQADQGEVKAVGKGKVDEQGNLLPLDVKVGDRVLFGRYVGQTVKVEGEELLVLREEDIMLVIAGGKTSE